MASILKHYIWESEIWMDMLSQTFAGEFLNFAISEKFLGYRLEAIPFTGWGGVEGLCQIRSPPQLIPNSKTISSSRSSLSMQVWHQCAPGDLGTAFRKSKKQRKRGATKVGGGLLWKKWVSQSKGAYSGCNHSA